MAQVYPKNCLESISNRPEKLMVQALQKHLDDDVVVYHGLHMISWKAPNEYREANHLLAHETDIVIVDPKRGILLIEVKGLSVECDADTGDWGKRTGNRWTPCKHPFGQACQNLAVLMDKIRQGPLKGFNSIPFPYGFAIAFPTKTIASPYPAWYEQAFVFSADDLARLGQRVEDCLTAWSNRRYPNGLPEYLIHDIKVLLDSAPTQKEISLANLVPLNSFLKGVLHLKEAQFATVEQSQKRIEELTEDQSEILDYLSDSLRLEIHGPAGSGKTMLALIQAKRIADRGKKALLLCFNSLLAEFLREQLKAIENVEVSGIYELVNRLAKKVGLEAMKEGDPGYWEELPGKRLENALYEWELKGEKPQYDALIVDEGQDFCTSWWPILEELIRPNEQGIKPLVIFHDPLQNLFRYDDVDLGVNQLPEKLQPGKLSWNCRNTKKIASYLSDLMKQDIPSHKNAEEGSAPITVKLKTQTKSMPLNDDAARQIEEWIKQGFEFKDIAILKPFRHDQQKMVIQRSGGQAIPLVEDLKAWRKGKGVLLNTVRKFKGMEANAILLFNLPKIGATKSYRLADHYVAASRGRLQLTMMVQPDFYTKHGRQ